MLKNKKCFLFDLDGVITSTDYFHFEAWSKTAEKLEIKLNASFEHKLKGVSRVESLQLILDYYDKQISMEEFDILLDFKNGYYLSLLKDLNADDKFEWIEELLNELNSKDIKTVIVSASRNAIRILEKLNLINYFTHIVDARVIKKSKPEPDVFLKGLEISGCQKEDAVVIEDSQAGINGAIAAGIDSIAYEPNDDSLVDYTLKVKSHKEIIDMIKEK